MLNDFSDLARKKGYIPGCLTIGNCIELAKKLHIRVSDIIIEEAMSVNQMSREEVTSLVIALFCHNLYAMEIGLTSGKSFLMGTVGQDLADEEVTIIDDKFLNRVLKYTLSAQVGHHVIGLMPCAGTGDSCTYTGLVKALLDTLEDQQEVARLVALLLKVGVIFQAGKSTTGCNMEGFGAGAAATAAVVAEMLEATPDQVGQSITLALSPTIANPCTPQDMVAGLCAAHLGGGVLIGHLAANLVVKTNIPVTVSPDVMIAMAAAVHPLSAKQIVPTVMKYMNPFFETNEAVECLVNQETRDRNAPKIKRTIQKAEAEAQALAAQANSIIRPFGNVVVGGSSQAVELPTNTARLAHALAEGGITGVKIELYPELFACRGISIPGILMAAVYGADSDNTEMYQKIMNNVVSSQLKVEIIEINEPLIQRITIYATGGETMIETLNQGGDCFIIKNALPSIAAAKMVAHKLNIKVVE